MSKIPSSIHRWKIYLMGDFDFFTLDEWAECLDRIASEEPHFGNFMPQIEARRKLRSLDQSSVTTCPLRALLLILPMANKLPEKKLEGEQS